MPKFAVGYINWFDHELIIEIVEAPHLMRSFREHSKWMFKNDENETLNMETMSIDDFKQECFNCDCMMDSVEIES